MEEIIGSHVSFKKEEQLIGSTMEAINYGANTFMFYTGAPQNTTRYPIDEEFTRIATELMKKYNIDKNNVVVHAPYIINLANNGDNYDFSIKFFKEEINRCEQLGIKKLVLHPGSHVGLGIDLGIKNIITALNKTIDSKTKVIICLETMAGKGSEIGSSFEQLKQIIDGVNQKEKIMICLDTCHLNDAGYDVTNFDDLLNQFDKIIGINKIGCIHINDSKNIKEAHKDRHENFGYGMIGFDQLIKIVYHSKLKNVPKILETPYISKIDSDKNKVYPPYKFEIEMILNKKFNSNLLNDIRAYYK
ncbi:MAG: deoxyribonuclease IV [Bacilli bacterium]